MNDLPFSTGDFPPKLQILVDRMHGEYPNMGAFYQRLVEPEIARIYLDAVLERQLFSGMEQAGGAGMAEIYNDGKYV
jgi:hypothetical protein